MRPLAVLADEILGLPHADMDCWQLVRHLFQHGQGITLDALPELNRLRVQEVWFRSDARRLIDTVQPWDVLVFTVAGPLADHAGVALDGEWFVHSRESIGVCKERLLFWEGRLLQVIRVSALTSLPSATS